MKKYLSKLFRNERGQALAEYHVLFPGSILMVLTVYVLLQTPLTSSYCSVVGMFNPKVCGAVVAESEEPEPTITPTPSPTEEACIVLLEEEGCSQCDHDPNCTCLPGVNSGTYSSSQDIQSLVIKAGREYHIYYTGYTDDGCYHVTIDGNAAHWQKVEDGNGCKDVSHLQSWYRTICE